MGRGPEAMMERAHEMGVELEERPAERIVITALSMRTPLGNTEQTWKGLLEKKSGIREFDVENRWVSTAGQVEFNPSDYFSEKEIRRGLAPIHALAIILVREAALMARLVDEDGNLTGGIKRRRVGTWTGTGIGSSQYMIDIHKQIYKKDEAGKIDKKRNSRGISPFDGLRLFPEQTNFRIANDKRIQGWSGTISAACASGLAADVELFEKIRTGRLDAGFATGVELLHDRHPEVSIGIFAAMRSVLSKKRNDNPEEASRPFDKDRDGFVLGSGGAVIVAERLDHAIRRGAPIFAEVVGFRNSIDGGNPTNIDIDNVVDTVFHALYDEKRQTFHEVDAIFAHATGTGNEEGEGEKSRGDVREAEVFRKVFGEDLPRIPITGNKGNIGHTAGASGSITLAEAVLALNFGIIPPIMNLENPDPAVEDLWLVRNQPLRRDIETAVVTSFGFGGNNSVVVLKRFKS